MMSSGCSDSVAVPATYDRTLDAASQARQAATVFMLEALVNIESGSGDAVGMQQLSDYLARQLAGLGTTVTRHKPEDGGVGENIVGRFEGTGSRSILLMAHMDTVYPRGFLAAMLTGRAQRKRLSATEITVDINRGRPAFNASTAGQALATKAQAIYREVGGQVSVAAERSGGGTDAAYAALSGKPVLQSLGLPGFGYHSNADESILIDSIPRRLYLATRLIMDLSLGR
jgi:acetylornithine deacetylase/succinyl-diaminopimelate desuccinylase-like protein